MATLLFQAQSKAPGSSLITLVDGLTTTGYRLDADWDWGNAAWDSSFAGSTGTQGARLASAEPQNRLVGGTLQVVGTSHNNLETLLSVLWQLADEMRRFGGTLTFRPNGGTYKQYFDVQTLDVAAKYGRLYHHNARTEVTVQAVCAPYLKYDSYDILDGFDTNTIGDYTLDAGSALVVKGGALMAPAALQTSRYRHTARGFTYQDVQATMKIVLGTTVATGYWQVNVNCDTTGADTYLAAKQTTTALTIIKVVAGVETVLATTAAVPVINTTYWLRVRREGRVVFAELFRTTEPTPLGTPDFAAAIELTVAEHLQFGAGHAGLKVHDAIETERYDDFRVEPFTYKIDSTWPGVRALRGLIPGDAPALGELVIDHGTGSGSSPVFAMFSWWKRPLLWSYVSNGDFEDDVDGWSVAAVTGVTGAATSNARTTIAGRIQYGAAAMQVICPATANTGTTYLIRQPFRQGVAYMILIWASSASQTTTARARLGLLSDIASSSTAVALSPTPSPYVALWSPAANRESAYACFEITAATATTLGIDGVVVCEARQQTLQGAIDASETVIVLTGNAPDDWPAAPFLAIMEPETQANREIVRVESVTGTTMVITRGQEGTAGHTHAASTTICPLPELRHQLEGKGAPPPHGIVEAETADASNLFTWAVDTNVSYRGGYYLKAGDALSGAGSAFADWLVDANLLVPDDYAGNDLAVEVWARTRIHTGLDTPTAILSVAPETATVASGVITSLYGHTRYAEEYGSAGKRLAKPSSGAITCLNRLGTVRFPINRVRPIRSRLGLRVTWGASTTGALMYLDYLWLVPAQGRCLSPTGKANDSDYPYFLEGTAEATKTVRSDLSGLVAKPPGSPYPDHGLGGSLIEVPAGNADVLLKLSNYVPDDPAPGTNEQLSHTGVLHVSVTPRARLARGS